MTFSTFLASLKENPASFERVFALTQDEFEQFAAIVVKVSRILSKDPLQGETLAAGILILNRFKLTKGECQTLLQLKDDKATYFISKKAPKALNKALAKTIEPLLSRVTSAIQQAPLASAYFSYYFDSFESLSHIIDSQYRIPFGTNIKLDRYRTRRVQDKKKSGQINFAQFMNCLLLDLEQFANKTDYIAWYLALAQQLYLHNSTHHPQNGFGKVQDKEAEHEIHYFRNQSKHPIGLFYKALTRPSATAQCIMPRITTLEKEFKDNFPSTFSTNLGRYNALGYTDNKTKELSYFNTSVGHSGLRASNMDVYIKAITHSLPATKLPNTVIDTLRTQGFLPPANLTYFASADATVLTHRLQHLKDAFINLSKQPLGIRNHRTLLKTITQIRDQRAQAIHAAIKKAKFKNINIPGYNRKALPPNSHFITIDCYLFEKKLESDNYTTGVTQVIVAFFGGLLNHLCDRRGLDIHTHRRQSFGFIRPTIGDMGSMRLRLSLGLEGAEFTEVVIEALAHLDRLLTTYDFTIDKEALHPVLQPGFVTVETPKGKAATDKTGIRFLKLMRSVKNCAAAVSVAHSHLNETFTTNQTIEAGFKQFIHTLVTRDNLEHCTVPALPAQPAKKPEAAPVLFAVLENLINYVIKTGSADNFIPEQIQCKHAYWCCLNKLHKETLKALELLSHYQPANQYRYQANAALLVENMLEYLHQLNGLRIIDQMQRPERTNEAAKLKATETHYASFHLSHPTAILNTYFSASGQQACSLAFTTAITHLGIETDSIANAVYVHDNFYFEWSLFLKDDLNIKHSQNMATAKLIFLDVTAIAELKGNVASFPAAEIVVIDITNNPCLDNPTLKHFIHALLKANKTIYLVGSMLKHEQLGLDKCQAGKLITIVPPGKELWADQQQALETISASAMNEVTAGFFNMMNTIYGDKEIGAPTPRAALKPK